MASILVNFSASCLDMNGLVVRFDGGFGLALDGLWVGPYVG